MTTQTTPATTGTQKKKPLSRIQTLHLYFNERRPQLQKVAPHHLRADRIVSIVLQAASRTPKLLECTMDSIYWCVNQAVQLGLEPASILQQFYLVPRWNSKIEQFECTPIIGYKGFAELARRYDPGMKRFDAAVVYAGETFTYDRGTGQISHPWRSDVDTSKDENIIAAWCLVQGSQASGPTILVLSRQQIEEHRAKSASPNVGPWKDHYPMMVRKTVIRALLSGGLVGISPDTEKAIALENKIDADPELVTLEAHEFSVGAAGPGVRPRTAAQTSQALEGNPNEVLEHGDAGTEGEPAEKSEPAKEEKPSGVTMPAEEPRKRGRPPGPRKAPETKPAAPDAVKGPQEPPDRIYGQSPEDEAEAKLQSAEDEDDARRRGLRGAKTQELAVARSEDADDVEEKLSEIPIDPPADAGKVKPAAELSPEMKARYEADNPKGPSAGAGPLFASKDKGELLKQIKAVMAEKSIPNFKAHRLVKSALGLQITTFQVLTVPQLQQVLEVLEAEEVS